jgi:hypothetical protein
MSDKRNDQAVSSPKGEKLADRSKYSVVRCGRSPGRQHNILKQKQLKKLLTRGDIECLTVLVVGALGRSAITGLESGFFVVIDRHGLAKSKAAHR